MTQEARAPAVGEWMWRFVALAMAFALCWMAWVMYLLNPPLLVTPAAYEASARAASAKLPVNAEGLIKPAAVPVDPAPAAEAKPPAPAPDPAEVLAALAAWARAWSAKDADAYLAAYAPGFAPPNGEPREAWEKARRARLAAPKKIAVTVENAKVEFLGDGRASVAFTQTYASDLVRAAATPKTLVLERADGRWRIVEEKSGG